MERGYIKIYRKLTESWVFEKPEYLKAWITMLMEANHQKRTVLFGGEAIECDRGESVKSLDTWCRILGKGWSTSKIRTFLKKLENDGMIVKKNSNKTTMISICNYDVYQDQSHTNDIQINNKSISNDTQIATNNNERIKELNKKETILTYSKEKDELFSLETEKIDNFENKPFTQWSEKDLKDSINQYPEFHKVSDLFWGYWTERSAKGKMKFTLEKTWDTKRRLITWWNKSNEKRFGYKNQNILQEVKEENQFSNVWDYENE